jgi:hypothetical protein
VRIVASVAIREHEGGGKVEVIVARAAAVAQEKSSAHGVEAEIGSSSGVAAADFLLHIT